MGVKAKRINVYHNGQEEEILALKGSDWIPTSDELNEIAESAAEKLQPTIATLSENVDNATLDITAIKSKDTEQDGRLTALEERPSGESVDVQINGESIVQDGVANIPNLLRLDDNGKISVVNKPSTTKWTANVGIGTDGNILLANMSPTLIDARTSGSFQFINGATLDYAVKAALTDGKGAAYTDAEKAAARERIGAENELEYKRVAYIDLQEKTKAINITKFADGSDLNCRHILIMANVPSGAETSGVRVHASNTSTFGTRQTIAYFYPAFNSSIRRWYCKIDMTQDDEFIIAEASGGGNADDWNAIEPRKSIHGTWLSEDGFKDIGQAFIPLRNIQIEHGMSGFPEGMKFIVYAR